MASRIWAPSSEEWLALPLTLIEPISRSGRRRSGRRELPDWFGQTTLSGRGGPAEGFGVLRPIVRRVPPGRLGGDGYRTLTRARAVASGSSYPSESWDPAGFTPSGVRTHPGSTRKTPWE